MFSRLHEARRTGRVSVSQSRVSNLARPKRTFGPAGLRAHGVRARSSIRPDHLKSAFPTKTVLFLLFVGGLGYYFVDIEVENWRHGVLSSYQEEQSHSVPLHFNRDKEELDHYLQFELPDPPRPLKSPQAARILSDEFDRFAYGWMMTEEDAQQDNMPVTHGCRFRSNEPCEDFFSIGTSPGTGAKPWNYWSIMDGHAGNQCANYLQWNLIPFVSLALSSLPAYSPSTTVETTIKETFLRVDKKMMDGARTAANWFPAANAAAVVALSPALSGSCALLAAFDPEKNTLRVACTGDSRAVLGRWDPATKSYTSIPLSVDQTGFNEKEVARLTKEHPDEPDMINAESGRLLGLAVTRAFGDHRWKWDNEFVKAVQFKFWGSAPRAGNKTPPYLTAEPEVSETEVMRHDVDAGRSDFMIMASDGLWDRISSEHAVECVQRWLEAKRRGGGAVTNDPRLKTNPPYFPSTFAPEEGVQFDVENGEGVDWKATPEFFAIEDDNAAVCLVRNALGGTRRGLFTGLLTVAGPFGRVAVDDTTIMVVFFDKVGEVKGEMGVEEKTRTWWKPWTMVR
ncbi:phosphatase 2C-like domain-containing protein [Ampelomyces quisqualis]|uniref:Phosphatase 2C-like domain-containing protein n=1 Tax=Ampelomyces quisqualis TaxID=50730 RepID=A0A6A5QIG9_AMPQU|nr:phosphatase 2C-like domain-containing protein [Ampelomyces quisqualis]